MIFRRSLVAHVLHDPSRMPNIFFIMRGKICVGFIYIIDVCVCWASRLLTCSMWASTEKTPCTQNSCHFYSFIAVFFLKVQVQLITETNIGSMMIVQQYLLTYLVSILYE